MESTRPLVAAVHATPATIRPVNEAYADDFPAADVWHLLDDRLVKDADRAGCRTPELALRMRTLIRYALDAGADAVQLCCSMYGPVAAQVAADVPVISSDQAMFDEVVALAPRHVRVLASLAPAAEDSRARLGKALEEAGRSCPVGSVVVAGAAAAASTQDLETLRAVMTEAARSLDASVDVIAFAQYSLAPVASAVAAAVAATVVTGPHLAASTMAGLLDGTPERGGRP
ncbi:hypothetical protein ACFU6I_17735 [Streptomyces sp. NPDC057486]|uniref:hypothetical protein n=1 Tax=Streptomyces sp. NPDC057486 TaxID=3346145 RepID=UPI0036BF0D03